MSWFWHEVKDMGLVSYLCTCTPNFSISFGRNVFFLDWSQWTWQKSSWHCMCGLISGMSVLSYCSAYLFLSKALCFDCSSAVSLVLRLLNLWLVLFVCLNCLRLLQLLRLSYVSIRILALFVPRSRQNIIGILFGISLNMWITLSCIHFNDVNYTYPWI